MKKILITGSIAYDVLLGFEGSYTDTINPEELESLSVSHFCPHFAKHHGGTGANIAWGIKLLGGNPLLVGAVGNDGGEFIDLLEARGISTAYIEQLNDHATATAILGTDSQERQIIFFHPGADAQAPWKDISEEREEIQYAIVSPRDMTAMVQATDWCDDYKVPLVFDPGQQVHMFGNDELERMVRVSKLTVVNEYEWGIMKKKLSCSEENFLMLCPTLIVTHGESGVTAFTGSGAITVPACSTDELVNPTGAGDAFRAGLLVGLTHDWSLLESCRLGCAMGSFAVEVDGSLIDHVDADEIYSRAEQTYREPLPEIREIS